MNKKIILQIVSILMTVCVIFTVGGCKGSSDEDSQIVNAKGDPIQPSINTEENQAIIKYTSVNSEGKEEEATKVLDIDSPSVNEVSVGSSLDQQYKTDDQKQSFIGKAELNGIGKDKAQEILNNAAEWVDFSYTIFVANTSSQFMHTGQLVVGKENSNVVLETRLDAEYGINAGTGYPIYISGLVNTAAFPDEESMIKQLNEMKVQLIYTLTDISITDIDDWDAVETDVMDIEFK